MTPSDNTDVITWRLHLNSPPAVVHQLIATDAGRETFWAERSVEQDGVIQFTFPNGITLDSQILVNNPPAEFTVEYFDGSLTSFSLQPDGRGGTDLTLTDAGVADEWWQETYAGWLSVLFALKAAVDFGIDLRNHDPERTWDQGFVEN